MAVGEVTEHGTVLFEARAETSWLPVLVGVLAAAVSVPATVFGRAADGSLVEKVVTVAVAVALTAVGVAAAQVHQRQYFQVTERAVVKRRVLGADVVVPRHEVAEAVVMREYAVPGARGPRAVLLGHSGRVLLTSVPLADLRLIEGLAMAAPRVTRVGRLRPTEVSRRWPHLLAWNHRHRALAITLAVIFVVVALAGIVAVVEVLDLRSMDDG